MLNLPASPELLLPVPFALPLNDAGVSNELELVPTVAAPVALEFNPPLGPPGVTLLLPAALDDWMLLVRLNFFSFELEFPIPALN